MGSAVPGFDPGTRIVPERRPACANVTHFCHRQHALVARDVQSISFKLLNFATTQDRVVRGAG